MANWYVRENGGTTSQCTGHTDANYPGSGTGQACAYANPQDAFNASARGDFIYLNAGDEWIGTIGLQEAFICGPKGAGTAFITVTTNAMDSALTAKMDTWPGFYEDTGYPYRVTTADAVNMPKLIGANDGYGTLGFQLSSSYWKFVGIEITNNSDVLPGYQIGMVKTDINGTPTGDQLAHHLTFEYCFVHPHEETGHLTTDEYVYRSAEKGLFLNGENFLIRRCAIQGFTGRNPAQYGHKLDTNAILIGAGHADGSLIEDCLLEGQANNVFTGGSGGILEPTHMATVSSVTIDATDGEFTGTFSSTTDLDIGDYFSVFVEELEDEGGCLAAYAGTDRCIGGATNAQVSAVNHSTGLVTATTGLRMNLGYRKTFIELFIGELWGSDTFKRYPAEISGTFTLTLDGETTAAITYPQIAASSVTSDSPALVTTSAAHGYATGDKVRIAGFGGGIDDYGYNLSSYVWTITVTGSTTFTLNGSFTRTAVTGTGYCVNHNDLIDNIRNALIALANCTAADFEIAMDPNYGIVVDLGDSSSVVGSLCPDEPEAFCGDAWSYPVDIGYIQSNGAGLSSTTGTPVVYSHLGGTEYGRNQRLEARNTPADGSTAWWEGYGPDNIVMQRNVFAKYLSWYANLGGQKGYAETKAGRGTVFKGNLFFWDGPGQVLGDDGEYYWAPGGLVLTPHQDGGCTWCEISNMEITSNYFMLAVPAQSQLADAIYFGPVSTNLTFSNNISIHPATGNLTDTAMVANSGVTHYNHNTWIFGYGQKYQRGDNAMLIAGSSITKDNVIRSFHLMFCTLGGGPAGCWASAAGDNENNLLLDADGWIGPYSPPTGRYWDQWANAWPDQLYEDAAFEDLFEDAANNKYWFPVGSPYLTASTTGGPLGVDFAQMITDSGVDWFNFGGEPEPPAGNVVVGGRHRVTMQ